MPNLPTSLARNGQHRDGRSLVVRVIGAVCRASSPAVIAGLLTTTQIAGAQDMPNGADNFYKSDKVTVEKVSFKNKVNLTVVGNLFTPKDLDRSTSHAAVIVGHPYGATKEQSSNLYATKLAEQGLVTLSFDLSFWGESEGQPRHTVIPDVYVDDFSAAVDFLGTRPLIDRNRIGVLGICGSGDFVVSAAQIDPRMKAVATVSMYDMGAASRNGLKKSVTAGQRQKMLQGAAEQRWKEAAGGEPEYGYGTVLKLTEKSNPIEREFFDFYRTPRGEFTPANDSPQLTTRPRMSSIPSFMHHYPFGRIESISPRPMLFITGDQAHSREFSEDAYKRAAEPKELVLVPGAGHVDLYDRTNLIPFDKLSAFFARNLK